MSDNPASPLLGSSGAGEESRPKRPESQKSRYSERSRHSKLSNHSEHPSLSSKPSERSIRSQRSNRSERSVHSAESTPLLSREVDHSNYGDDPAHRNDIGSAAASSLRSLQNLGSGKGKKGRRWPTIIALTLLCLIMTAIIGLCFAAPAVLEEYAKEAMVFEPTDLSIDSLTSSGVKARIQGDFTLDASRVHKKPVRDLGRFGTWIASAVESKQSKVKVYLPEYGNVLLGTADVPRVVIDIRNGHTTHVDFLSDLVAGDIDGIRHIANDWLEGRLGQLRVQGIAQIGLKSGLFSLGTQKISQSLVFKGHDLPAIPQYNITKLNFREIKHGQKGMAVDVSLTLMNEYPVTFTVPPLGFDILIPDCSPEQPFILFANAKTAEIKVTPRTDVNVDVGGIVRELPETLLTACPESEKSPLDLLLSGYIHGDETTIYVRGTKSPSPDTPQWITDLLKSVIVPVPFPGHTFDGLIRDFSLANVHFSLPDPFAEPGSPKSQPRLSAVVKALVNLPEEMNFPIKVGRVRADADVFYQKKKLGSLDLSKWQRANSTRIEVNGKTPAGLAVESIVKKAPLEITDDDVFADLVQALIFGSKGIILGVKAQVDVETETALGKFIVRDLPAQGRVFVKPISGGTSKTPINRFNLKIGALQILDTTKSTLTLAAKINVTNPTEYAATVPYVNLHLFCNGTLLGHAVARDLSVVPGLNHNLEITAVWDPTSSSTDSDGDSRGVTVGRELISQYISGYNTSLTLRTHAGTIPSQPGLGAALAALQITVPTPRLHPPKNPNHDDGPDDPDDPNHTPRFIDDATMHLLSSTATLTLLSPLPVPLTITHLDATAVHNGTQLGRIIYTLPFDIPPGASTSPALPVDWSFGQVGYDEVKKALGGRLKVEARADVGVRLGRWTEEIWYVGKGVGARIRWF